MTEKRVAIIGAGCSGLAAIKCCLDEGLTPVCFERSEGLGGLWRYTDQVAPGSGCVMKSTVINTSKELMSFSDFPVPAEYPNFMHNSMVLKYLQEYSRHFDLHRHIRFNTEVRAVKKSADYDVTGRWDVTVASRKSQDEKEADNAETHDAESTETYDAVLLCTGHHAERHQPELPGLADFQGKVIHAQDYREPSAFAGQRVLIVGIGNSGGDMAVELGRSGQVFLSTRRGTWVIHRLNYPGGLPVDVVNLRRVWVSLVYSLPAPVRDFLVRRHLNQRLDHDFYGLTPSYSPLAQHPMVNDDLANRIACGSVVIKPDVEEFTATGVRFEDGTCEDVDVVILATGYKFSFPFLQDEGVLKVKDNRLPLYKYMYPPALPHPTLAAVGFVQPLGAVIPISEMQCRLATRVIKGEVKLPSAAAMWNDVADKEAAMSQRYVTSPRHTIQVDYVSFMDELAELIGCKPDFASLLKSDPAVLWQTWMGPCTPYQYRLCGPGRWKGARQAVMTTMARVQQPLTTRSLPVMSDSERVRTFFGRLLLLLVVLVLLVATLPDRG